MAPRSNKKVVVEPKEEPMEAESTESPMPQTPKSKKNAQSKLTSFFGGAAKAKNATEGGEKAESSGLKSPKKEPESPEKSPRKSGGGKKKEEEKQKKGKKIVVEVKKEVKEEPMSEEEENENQSKGAKKRPLSKTLPSPSKKSDKTNGGKKQKHDDKENKSTRASRGNAQKKGESKSSSKNAPVKVEPIDITERLAKIEKHRLNAFKFSEDDQIGAVVQRAHESMMAMMKSGADPQKIKLAKEALKNEREGSIKADKASGKTDPERDMVYSMCEKLEKALDAIAARELKLREVKKEVKGGEQIDGADSMFAVSVGGVGKVKVEVKEEEEMLEENEAL